MTLTDIQGYTKYLTRRSYVRDCIYLTIVLGALFTAFMGGRPLAAPDEGRYVEIPREMVATGNYVTPHLNGLKYFEKPPLVYWLEALPLKLGASSEWTLRLPIAIMALLGCLFVYGFTTHLYSRIAGVWSSIILGTNLLYFSLARFILLDLVVSVFLTGGLLAFISGFKDTSYGRRRSYFAVSSLFFGLAVLSKGLIGLALPGLIIGLWVLALNLWHKLRPLFLPTNLLILATVIIPWHFLAYLETPEFFDFYFIHEHFTRYLTTTHNRYQPFWFFLPILLIGFFPWTMALPRALKDFLPQKWRQWPIYDVEIFILLWALLPLLFFSISSSKLVPYITPVLPPLAIITGRFIAYRWRNQMSLMPEFLTYSGLSLTIALVGFFYFRTLEHSDPALWTRLTPYVTTVLWLLAIGGVSVPLIAFKFPQRWALAALVSVHIAVLFTLNQAAPFVQKSSMKILAQKINHVYGSSCPVVAYHTYPQDLAPYLGRTVHIVEWQGELAFGHSLVPQNTTMMSRKQLTKQWASLRPLCIVTKKIFFPELNGSLVPRPIVLGEEDPHIVMCNQRLPA